MKQPLILALTVLVLQAPGQTLFYSQPETKDFDRFRFHTITRKDNRLVIYKAVSFNSALSTGPLLLHSAPGGAIVESDISVYDSLMGQISETRLPLPKEISGVDFIVYDDFFYLIYQYLRDHLVCCMAVKVDFTGQFLAPPVCLDSTRNPTSPASTPPASSNGLTGSRFPSRTSITIASVTPASSPATASISIYNETIRNKQFLSGQCIDAGGMLNPDSRFREDQPLDGQNDLYTYYPRLAEQVGADELIIPCRKGRQVCLAKLRL
ncbi:MAG TPA: hypothetical protein VHE34_05950 [Puia sp.]|uniref:hypothetical protein n=1 Tax=Puia sp. TaxID=2045100 RepID=UPI002B662269|nr:hypothetical protein [Puia sp.]HVU94745.1 hypothetical protein [Puia sp.]